MINSWIIDQCFFNTQKWRTSIIFTWFVKNRLNFYRWLAYKPCISLSWLFQVLMIHGLLTYSEITWRLCMSGTDDTPLRPHATPNYVSKLRVFYYSHFIDRCYFKKKESITLFMNLFFFITLYFYWNENLELTCIL